MPGGVELDLVDPVAEAVVRAERAAGARSRAGPSSSGSPPSSRPSSRARARPGAAALALERLDERPVLREEVVALERRRLVLARAGPHAERHAAIIALPASRQARCDRFLSRVRPRAHRRSEGRDPHGCARLHRLRAALGVRAAAAQPELPRRHVVLFSSSASACSSAMLTAMAVFAKESEEEEHEAVATEFETGRERPSPRRPRPPAARPSRRAGGRGRRRRPARRCSPRAGCGELPHAVGRGLDRDHRPEPGRGQAEPRSRGRARHERHEPDALVQGLALEKQIQDVAAYVVASTSGSR